MKFVRLAHVLLILTLMGTLTASIFEQHENGQIPCAYCILQRNLMILVAMTALMNLRFGIQIKHYGLMLLTAGLGALVSLTQIALHACPEFPQFGVPVFGLSLYTWSFIVFASCILSTAIFLMLYEPAQSKVIAMEKWEKAAGGIVFFMIVTIVYLTLKQCGFGDCQEKWYLELFTKP